VRSLGKPKRGALASKCSDDRRCELPGSDGDAPAGEREILADAIRRRLLRFGPTVEVVLFAVIAGELSVLLVRRAERPDEGKWGLPGDLVALGAGLSGFGEGLEDTADRVLNGTGLGLSRGYLEQLRTYGGPWRHPLVRAFSIVYVASTPQALAPSSGEDQAGTRFFAVKHLGSATGPQLAFDHAGIVADAVERAQSELERDGRLAASLLDGPFSIPGLRRVYEAVWGGPVHRGDFRRKVLSVKGFLVATDEHDNKTGGPAANLYRLGPNATFRPPMARGAMLLTRPANESAPPPVPTRVKRVKSTQARSVDSTAH
jgi:8-oxo-dGTP diphosphatase